MTDERKDRDPVSEEQLHAFVDGELDGAEKERIFAISERSPDLDVQLCEYRKLKDMLRHAYAQPPQPPRSAPLLTGRGATTLRLIAGIALLAIGVLVGWISHAPVGDRAAATAGAQGEVAAAAVPTSPAPLLLHVASSDPASLAAALDIAERTASEGSGRRVEVVANEGGLDLLRSDVTPFADRVLELADRQVLFFACSTAIQRLREKGIDVRILPQANVEFSALDRVILRLREGWDYEKI